jgi:hypothetical protein
MMRAPRCVGAGSTIAAALAVGYDSIGIEEDPAFFAMAQTAIPAFAHLAANAGSPAPGNGLRSPAARLRTAAAFELPGVAIRGGRPIVA